LDLGFNLSSIFIEAHNTSLWSQVGHLATTIAIAVGIMVVGLLVAAAIQRLLRRTLVAFGAPSHAARIISRLVYYAIAFFAGVSALAAAGVNVTGLLFAGGILGLALGLASKTIVSSFLSGLFLYFDKPFKLGDIVEIKTDQGTITGSVVDASLFSIRVRTLEGTVTRIPNDKVFGAVMRNLTGVVARRIEYIVGISYSSDIEKARKVILEALESYPWALAEPKPQVFVDELGDSSVNLRVWVWVPAQKWIEARYILLQRIKEYLDRAGIEIPFPQRVVWLRSLEAK